jgi:hypothetical protein
MRYSHCTPQHSTRNLGQLWTLSCLVLSLTPYNCLVSDSDSYRVCDNIILYPAPLVLAGASRFDQLLALTQSLTLAAESHTPHDQAQLSLCVGSLNNFLRDDADTQTTPAVRLQLPTSLDTPTAIPSAATTIPVTQATRHRPSSDTGADLIGWTFHERSLDYCKFLHTDTYLDSDSILWNTLAYSSSKAKDTVVSKDSEVRKRCKKGKPLHAPTLNHATPALNLAVPPHLTQQHEHNAPFRAMLHPPKTLPPVSTHQYNMRLRRILSACRILGRNNSKTNSSTPTHP